MNKKRRKKRATYVDSVTSASDILKLSSECLDSRVDKELLKDINLTLYQVNNPFFRVAVLAPFNFGKSTLINALLGSKVLPSKAVRTTGIPIEITYSPDKILETSVTLVSGKTIRKNGSELLSEFAILDRKGRQRDEVDSIKVFSCRKLLRDKIQIVDLPGTNDSIEQDEKVRAEILKSDLVIQVLNANQAFTLEEQRKTRDWLVGRGVKTSIFVINKMNQIQSEDDRREIIDDAIQNINHTNISSPGWTKSIHRVDALPALEAAENRHVFRLWKSGIIEFKANLHTFIHFQRKRKEDYNFLRLSSLSGEIKDTLFNRKETLENELKIIVERRQSIILKGKQKESYFVSEVNEKVQMYRDWASFDSLVRVYEAELAEALEQRSDDVWRNYKFKEVAQEYVKPVEKWIKQASRELGNEQPERLVVSIPDRPTVSLPNKRDRSLWESVSDVFSGGKNADRIARTHNKDVWNAYKKAARQFLFEFSVTSLASLDTYEERSKALLLFNEPAESDESIRKKENISKLGKLIDNLERVRFRARHYENRLNKDGFFDRLQANLLLTRIKVLCFLGFL